MSLLVVLFQSALPVRGATPVHVCDAVDVLISLRAPREGSDETLTPEKLAAIFQSALPVRGATIQVGQPEGAAAISIRAPREGSDQGG